MIVNRKMTEDEAWEREVAEREMNTRLAIHEGLEGEVSDDVLEPPELNPDGTLKDPTGGELAVANADDPDDREATFNAEVDALIRLYDLTPEQVEEIRDEFLGDA